MFSLGFSSVARWVSVQQRWLQSFFRGWWGFGAVTGFCVEAVSTEGFLKRSESVSHIEEGWWRRWGNDLGCMALVELAALLFWINSLSLSLGLGSRGWPHVAKVSLKPSSSCFHLPSAGATDMYWHTWEGSLNIQIRDGQVLSVCGGDFGHYKLCEKKQSTTEFCLCCSSYRILWGVPSCCYSTSEICSIIWWFSSKWGQYW